MAVGWDRRPWLCVDYVGLLFLAHPVCLSKMHYLGFTLVAHFRGPTCCTSNYILCYLTTSLPGQGKKEQLTLSRLLPVQFSPPYMGSGLVQVR